MRWTEYFIPTLKEVPAEAEAVSHRLMIRAGLIRKLASGAYIYLPLGLRVLKKVENIIREEMDKKGAIELFLPSLQPVELWHQSGRYKDLGEDLIKFKDRHNRVMVFGPTHEEVITDLVKNHIRSYRQLPINLYQIQTKFRDEVRPRFGIIRSREFIMKDAYSFDRDNAGLDKSYEKMYAAYEAIFKRCGLKTLAVEADVGIMGGDVSHEFMVLAESGEDLIAHCSSCGYAASLKVAACSDKQPRTNHFVLVRGRQATRDKGKKKALQEVDTPGVSTIEKVGEFLKVSPEQMVKTLIYCMEFQNSIQLGEFERVQPPSQGVTAEKCDEREHFAASEGQSPMKSSEERSDEVTCIAGDGPVAILIRGDHEANEAKIKRYLKCQKLEMATEDVIKKVTGGPLGFSGPTGLKIRIIADNSIKGMANFVTGANKKDKHLMNVNLDRDFKVKEWADLRMITEDDNCPNCNKRIKIEHAIEMGHVFKLGLKYSRAMKAEFLDEDGKLKPVVMGCYGIGVNRIIAACIELNNDKKGIIWPLSIAPFQVIIVPVNYEKDNVRKVADQVYKDLIDKGIEVLLDNRNESAGVKFNDAELIGMPYVVVIGERGLKKGILELKDRRTNCTTELNQQDIIKKLPTLLA